MAASDELQALPGFEQFVGSAVADRAGAEDLTDGKRYTAEVLMRDYPGVYKSIVRALFFYRLPNRLIRDLFRVAGSTVQAIRDHVLAASSSDGRAAFFINSRSSSQRSIVIARLIDELEERMSSPERLAEIDTTVLVDLIGKLERGDRRSDVSATPARADITIVDQSSFDDVVDGLQGEKNGAAVLGVGEGVGDGVGSVSGSADGGVGEGDGEGGECSTGSVQGDSAHCN